MAVRTHADSIFDYLMQNKGKAICDDCLSDKLEITPRQQVNARTEAFGLCYGFTREKAACSKCEVEKLVIRAK